MGEQPPQSSDAQESWWHRFQARAARGRHWLGRRLHLVLWLVAGIGTIAEIGIYTDWPHWLWASVGQAANAFLFVVTMLGLAGAGIRVRDLDGRLKRCEEDRRRIENEHAAEVASLRRALATAHAGGLANETCVTIAKAVARTLIIDQTHIGVAVFTPDANGDTLVRLAGTRQMNRPPSRLIWRKGHGAAGIAWRDRDSRFVDQTDLVKKRQVAFRRTKAERRSGLEWNELQATKDLCFISAIFLPGQNGHPDLILCIDTNEASMGADRFKEAVSDGLVTSFFSLLQGILEGDGRR